MKSKNNSFFLNPYFLFFLNIFFFIFKIKMHFSIPIYVFRNGFGDAFVKIMMSYKDVVPDYGVWKPQFIRLIQYSIAIYKDIYISPRILALIIFVFLFFLLAKFYYLISKNKVITMFSLFFLINNPLISSFITISLDEPIFAVFFISGLYFLFLNRLEMSLIFFNLSHAFRYESLYFFPVIFIYLIYKIKKKEIKITQFTLFVFLYFLIPFFWGLQNLFYKNDFFYFIKEKYIFAGKYNVENIFFTSFKWIKIFFLEFGILNLLLLIISFSKIIFNEEKIILIISSLFFIITLIFQVQFGSMEWYPEKYTFLSILLVIPLLSEGIYILLNNSKKKLYYFTIFILSVNFFINIKNDFYFNYKSFLNNYKKTNEYLLILELKKIKNVLHIYNPHKFPYDRDEIMYYANKKDYSSIDINELSQNNSLLYSFEYIVLDNLKIDEWRKIQQKFKMADQFNKILYQNKRFILIKK